MRDSFIFYRSFFEAISDLPNENQLEIYNAIADFSLNFKEPNLSGLSSTIFKLIKPQLEANNKRFENGSKPKQKRNISKTEAKKKQVKSKTEANNNVNNNVNVNDNINTPFSFSLGRVTTLSNTSEEYQLKLKEYIFSNFRGLTYEDFYNNCEMKGYKYKNFKLVYDKWTKDYVKKENKIFGEWGVN